MSSKDEVFAVAWIDEEGEWCFLDEVFQCQEKAEEKAKDVTSKHDFGTAYVLKAVVKFHIPEPSVQRKEIKPDKVRDGLFEEMEKKRREIPTPYWPDRIPTPPRPAVWYEVE